MLAPPTDRPNAREAVYIGLLLLYIAAQIVIPLTQLPYRFNTPLGWKMFAYYGPVPSFRLVYGDGRTEELTAPAASRLARTLRPEVDPARFSVPVLCARFPEAAAVDLRAGSRQDWRRVPCR
jgi:hypothetical protein